MIVDENDILKIYKEQELCEMCGTEECECDSEYRQSLEK